MNAVQALTTLIKSNVIIPATTLKGRNCIKLVEEEGSYGLTILGCPNDVIAIKCDKFPEPNSFFIGKNGECKRADRVIISSERECIIVIEMKKVNKHASNSDVIDQLKGARCVLDYCNFVIYRFLGVRNVFSNYKERYFKSVQKGSQKRPFILSSNPYINNMPDRFDKIKDKTIEFCKLIK